MTLQSFPDVNEAAGWHSACREGLSALEQITLRSAKEPRQDWSQVQSLDDLSHRSIEEVCEYFEIKEQQHDVLATLAILAACEGAIRRDLRWRADGDRGQLYRAQFLRLAEEQLAHKYIPIQKVLGKWRSVLRGSKQPHAVSHIQGIDTLFVQVRNRLAHGQLSANEFVFSVIHRRLVLAQQKWKQAVSDFRGY